MTQVIIPSFQALNQLHGLVCFVSSASLSVAFFSHRSLTRICIDHLPCLLKLPTLSQGSQRVGKAVTPCGFPLDVINRSTNQPSHIPTQPEVILFSICVQGEALPRRDGDLSMTKMGWNMTEPSKMALEATEMPHRKTWKTLFIHQPTIHRNEKLLGGSWGAFSLLKEKQPVCVGLIIERSLEVKLPTIWTNGREDVGRVREEKRREEEIRSEKRKSQKTEGAGARKGSKAAKHCAFPMIYGSGGSKSRLAKAAGAEPSGQMRDEKLQPVVARSTFEVKMCKIHQVRSTFGS